MTYRRVIPRDLFNEGNLLKCLGMLYLETERFTRPVPSATDPNETVNAPLVVLYHRNNEFYITQNEADGSIRVGNITILIGGVAFDHYRPLNSREPWPLYIEKRNACEAEPIEVFNEHGKLTPEMLLLLARMK